MAGKSPDLEAIFFEARQRAPQDRSAYLDRVCAEVLEEHGRRLWARRMVAGEVGELARKAQAAAGEVELPADLRERVRARQEAEPELPWEDALEAELLAHVTPAKGSSAS